MTKPISDEELNRLEQKRAIRIPGRRYVFRASLVDRIVDRLRVAERERDDIATLANIVFATHQPAVLSKTQAESDAWAKLYELVNKAALAKAVS